MKAANFFAELNRRNVYKVSIAYAIVGWLLIQVATQVFPFFEIPNWGVSCRHPSTITSQKAKDPSGLINGITSGSATLI